MILNSPYITGSLTVTGDATIAGNITVTGSLSGTAATASFALTLGGTGSVGFATTGAFSATSGSASSRLTQIEQVYATTGSNSFRATQSITGSLTVTGQIIAQTLNVQQVTSSIVFSSGSNTFGCDLNSRQTFTGSVLMTGSLIVNTTGPELQVTNNGVILGNLLTDNHSITGSLRVTGSNVIIAGALSGTSATFSGNAGLTNGELTVKTSAFGGVINLESGTNTNKWLLYHYSPDNTFRMNYNGSGNDEFILSTAGAATFASSIGAASAGISSTSISTTPSTTLLNSRGIIVDAATTTNNAFVPIGFSWASSISNYNPTWGMALKTISYNAGTADLVFYTGENVRLTISNGGAATFASSVTTNADIITNYGNIKLYSFQNVAEEYKYIGTEYGPGNGNNRAEVRFGIDGSDTRTFVSFATAASGGTIAERMRITSAGVVSINSSGAEANAGLDRFTMGYFVSNYGWMQTWASTPLYLNRLGNNVSAFGSAGFGLVTTTSSDVRIKKNIVSIESALDKVNALRGVYFEFDKNNELKVSVPHSKTRVGLIAQEVETIIPEAVIDGDNEGTPKSVDYTGLVGVLVKAIQELKAEVDDLKSQLNK